MNKVLIIVLLCGSGVAIAQPEKSTSDKIPIEQIISSYSKATGEKALLDPRVKARVSLYGQSLDQLSYDNLTTILRVHNFASYRSGGYLVIIPLNIIKQQAIGLVQQGQQYVSNQIVNDLIMLDKLCPSELVPMLRPLVPPSAHFGLLWNPRVIFLTDTYANTQRIRALVEKLESHTDRKQACVEPKQ